MTVADIVLGSPPAVPPRKGRMARGGKSALALLGPVRRAAAVCVFVVIITFALIRLIPGDPVSAIAGARATPEIRAELTRELHLDGSFVNQFGSYLGSLLRGDLGTSLVVQPGHSVLSILGATLPVTLGLVGIAVIFSVLVGVPVGLLAAVRGRAADTLIRIGAITSLAVPPFFFGLVLILLFALRWPIFPAGGWEPGLGVAWRYLVLPAVALAGYLTPLITRATRQAASDALREPWAEAAMARGMSATRISLRHVLPNSLLPIITLVGYNIGVLLAGAVVVEAVFGLPGIGQQLVNAINQRDYPVIQGIALVSAVVVVISNLVADVIIARLDPRIGAS